MEGLVVPAGGPQSVVVALSLLRDDGRIDVGLWVRLRGLRATQNAAAHGRPAEVTAFHVDEMRTALEDLRRQLGLG